MIDRYRFILLESIILGMVVLGICLGLGTVKEESSFGLRDVLQILGVVAGALCTFQGGPRPPLERESAKETKEPVEKKE